MAIKKKMQMGGKAKPMSGAIGAYSKLKGKDLELEKANYKKFGDGPGSGPSGAMPKPKKKMGGAVKKAASGGSFPDLNKDGKITKADILKGRGVIAKKGASVKKGCMKCGGKMYK
jgi:hypothetical protein